MKIDNHALSEWFGIVTGVLEREDTLIRNNLQPYSTGAYEYWDRGIALLSEPVIHYIILRELWSRGYPRALGWEHSYPDWMNAKLDLAIYHQRPDERVHGCGPEHLIEVKIKRFGKRWEDQKQIWWDFLRLLWWSDPSAHRYLLLLTIGPDWAPLENDVNDLLSMRLGWNREQYTPEQLFSRIITKSIEYITYCLMHFDGVHEVMWDEFATKIRKNQAGKVRVSLIEVFCKN